MTIIEAIIPSIVLAKDLFNIMFLQLILSHFEFSVMAEAKSEYDICIRSNHMTESGKCSSLVTLMHTSVLCILLLHWLSVAFLLEATFYNMLTIYQKWHLLHCWYGWRQTDRLTKSRRENSGIPTCSIYVHRIWLPYSLCHMAWNNNANTTCKNCTISVLL